jgi:hypothetical protein
MAVHFYLVPKIGDGITPFTAFRPKYTDRDSVQAGWNVDGRWTSLDYGAEDAFLLSADLTAGEHTLLSALSDVITIPNLNSLVSSTAIATVKLKLEGANLPADWVTTELTYRQVITVVRKCISFMQRFRGLYQDRIFSGGITLDSRINQIPLEKRTRLADTATDLGLSVAGITGTTTIRKALVMLASQLPGVVLSGEQV